MGIPAGCCSGGMTHRFALFIHSVTQVHLTVQVDKVVIACKPEHLNRKSSLRGLAILHHLNGCILCVWTSEWGTLRHMTRVGEDKTLELYFLGLNTTLLPVSCVTLGSPLNLSVSQILHMHIGVMSKDNCED